MHCAGDDRIDAITDKILKFLDSRLTFNDSGRILRHPYRSFSTPPRTARVATPALAPLFGGCLEAGLLLTYISEWQVGLLR